MFFLETERLKLSELTKKHVHFIYELLNDKAFIEHIGDKGVRNLLDAENYILTGPVASYKEHGFGLYHVELKKDKQSIGICGLLKRDYLDKPDIGYAFLEAHRGKGFAYESANGIISYYKKKPGFEKILAFVSDKNKASIQLLEKLGFKFEKVFKTPEHDSESQLYSL